MMGIHYGGFFGLRKFNKRYEGLDEEKAPEPEKEPDEVASAYPSDDYE